MLLSQSSLIFPDVTSLKRYRFWFGEKLRFFNFYFFYLKIYFLTLFLFSKCFLRTFVNYNRISITYLRGAISLCAYQNTIRVLLYSVFYSNRVEKVVLWWTEILYAYKKRKTCFTDTWRHPFTLFCKSKKKGSYPNL